MSKDDSKKSAGPKILGCGCLALSLPALIMLLILASFTLLISWMKPAAATPYCEGYGPNATVAKNTDPQGVLDEVKKINIGMIANPNDALSPQQLDEYNKWLRDENYRAQSQLTNAKIMYGVLNKYKRDAATATLTFIVVQVESNFLNVPYGDADSVGLFQQRKGGYPRNRMDPVQTTEMFLERLDGEARNNPDWRNNIPAMAQAVQVSGHPDRYGDAGVMEKAKRLLKIVIDNNNPYIGNLPPSPQECYGAEEGLSIGFDDTKGYMNGRLLCEVVNGQRIPNCKPFKMLEITSNSEVMYSDKGAKEYLGVAAGLQAKAMATAFKKQFGDKLCVTDAYRPFTEQQIVYQRARPGYAAKPGKSNHGWGAALDLCGGIENEKTAQHQWLLERAADFGWIHPSWAKKSPFEPWHWEFCGESHTSQDKECAEILRKFKPTSSAGSTGVAAVEAAASLIGVPYKWGGGDGNGPTNGGVDCSGLVMFAINQMNVKYGLPPINLPHSAEAQGRNSFNGQSLGGVKIGDGIQDKKILLLMLQPGDVVTFGTSHVGIYAGVNAQGVPEMIHAPRTGKNVERTSLLSSYYLSKDWHITRYAKRPSPQATGQKAVPVPAAAPATAAAPPVNSTKPLSGKTIVVDPGHNSGTKPVFANKLVYAGNGKNKACDTLGATGAGGYRESRYNWELSLALKAKLEAQGAKVVMTRANDSSQGPCVNQRAAIGNSAGADAAISIHADDVLESGARGFHVIIPKAVRENSGVVPASDRLGKSMRNTFVSNDRPLSNYVGKGTGLDSRNDLGGLNLSTVPKVFIETGNMRHPTDLANMKSAVWRDKAAEALTMGFIAYFRGS